MYVILFTLFLAWIFYEMYWKRRNLPPGWEFPPSSLFTKFQAPLLCPWWGISINFSGTSRGMSSLPRIRNNSVRSTPGGWVGTLSFEENKSLGPTVPVVNICDYDLLKETFVRDGDSYTDKFEFSGLNEVFRGGIDYSILKRCITFRRKLWDCGVGWGEMEGTQTICTPSDERSRIGEDENGRTGQYLYSPVVYSKNRVIGKFYGLYNLV